MGGDGFDLRLMGWVDGPAFIPLETFEAAPVPAEVAEVLAYRECLADRLYARLNRLVAGR